MHLVSALARRRVTVALSGDGGDELFGGYGRYLLTANWWQRIGLVPRPLRATAARALRSLPATPTVRGKLLKGANMLECPSQDEAYDLMLSQWADPAMCVIGASTSKPPRCNSPDGLDGIDRMMAQDLVDYLPNDILTKIDRAAMAVSLETRVPLLDPDVIEFAWRLPLGLKFRDGTGKWLLRQVLYRHVPRELIERPKMGFGVPLDSWLRGPLRDWAEALLDERRLRNDGYFHVPAVRKIWEAQLRGENNGFKLWTVLMFQTWLGTARTEEVPSSRATAASRQPA